MMSPSSLSKFSENQINLLATAARGQNKLDDLLGEMKGASGGIVSRPTRMLVGEAGPEAVMPLKRGRDGKLGVAAEGGTGDNIVINQTFNMSANGDDSVKRIMLETAPQISNYVKRDIIASRQRGGQMREVFR